MKLKTVRQFSTSICDVSIRHSHIRHGGISNVARSFVHHVAMNF